MITIVVIAALALGPANVYEDLLQSSSDALRAELLQAVKQATEDQAACRIEAWRASHTSNWAIIFPNGQIERVPAFLKNCTPSPASAFENLEVRFYGGDTAIMTAQFRRLRADGTPGPPLRITQVWVKERAKWLNANSQVTPVQP